MALPQKIKVLVAPLDWGLGHTTRSVPVIQKLIENGVEVVLAGNAVQQKILTKEFPDCTFLSLPGYNVKYSKRKGGFAFKMLQQLPGILSSIVKEHNWLKSVVAQHRIDGVISDNRFGLYHKSIRSVFMTHQLRIQTGTGFLADIVVQRINYFWINKFSACWIPDFEGEKNLAGVLSHPARKPKTPCWFVGALSRLQISRKSLEEAPKVLFVLSGPEPQRSIFEQLIFEQLANYTGKAIVVRGMPGSACLVAPDNVLVYDHLPKEEMELLLKKAQLIICRSGYSSVMDINAVEAKSVLVPTPGQAEQEYLGEFLSSQRFAPGIAQHRFDLQRVLEIAKSFAYEGFIAPQPELLERAVRQFVNTLKDDFAGLTNKQVKI